VKKSIAVAMALREAQDADGGDAIEETALDESNDDAVADGGDDTSHATDE
jgi:hypothetical protein